MGGLGVLGAVFGIVIILSLAGTGQNGEVNTTSSTGGGTRTQETVARGTQTEPETRLSPEEVERKLDRLYRELDSLEEDLREARLREPVSPYTGMVTLRASNAKNTDPDREYITLTASSRNDVPINISDWYVESYVTEERSALPLGVRVPTSIHRSRNQLEDIFLEPGERALLHTKEAPQNFSFHENLCTGYFNNEGDYSPRLRNQCPQPEDEMEAFASIDLDNDECYEFVEDIRRCEVPNEDDVIDSRQLSARCERFIIDNLNYAGCVSNHRYEPYFDNVGVWHIYLDEDEDMWRREREIIRIIDEEDRVIDVVEY